VGHVLQAKRWVRHPRGCSFGFLWLRKLAKTMTKALEMHEALIGILLMKIMEIRRK